MNKRELLDFIERVQHKAVRSVEDRFEKEIEKRKVKCYLSMKITLTFFKIHLIDFQLI
ncbi:MAG: hypothetical protein E7C22_17760 [Clostridium sp.]|uniref:hypothetical protein n=1 Tax=Clostridium sp. TaxID=1506 RepID=UPI0028FF8CA9|nr:hypothetical protein [Clostridium sp.]MDU2756825.1 hypothetical protein [Clostridium sp.]MDU2902394.1 hypothetical protein [Clostridium sp.]